MFSKGMIPDLIDYLSKKFDKNFVDLKGALKDEQRALIRYVAEGALADLTRQFEALYESYAPLMQYVKSLGLDYPSVFRYLLQYYIERSLVSALATAPLNSALIEELAKWASSAGVEVGTDVVEYFVNDMLELLRGLSENPADAKSLNDLESLLRSYVALGLPLERLTDVQEAFVRLRDKVLVQQAETLKSMGLESDYKALGKLLKVKYL
jgi:hypothetical protein